MLAKCVQDSKSRILGEGVHMIESDDFNFLGFEDVMKNHCIQHGTITILRVTRGKIALAWKDNDPLFISEPGLYEFDSPDFSFDSFRSVIFIISVCIMLATGKNKNLISPPFYHSRNAEEHFIQLGAKKIIQVPTGQGMFITF